MQPSAARKTKKTRFDPFNVEVGSRLAFLRRAMGYGDREQAAFARQVGLRPNHLSMIESGQRGLRPQQAIRVCRQFGVTTDWIYMGQATALPDELRRKLTAALTKM